MGPLICLTGTHKQINTHLHTHHTREAGSKDASIMVWDPASASAITKLEGHKWQVSTVRAMPNGNIVSASLDK